MIKQDWMIIIAGEAVVDALSAETTARVKRNERGFESESLCAVQRSQAQRGIIGAEVVESIYGCSVRYDSGLQNFGLLASSRAKDVDGTLEDAERWARAWVAKDPERRYAWRRKTNAERLAHIFAELLRKALTAEQMVEVNRLNEEKSAGDVCHSHDYLDSNETMYEAFEKFTGREMPFDSDKDAALWNEAWNVAVAHKFWTP